MAAAAAAAVEAAAIGGVVITPLLSIRLSGNGEKCAKKNFVLHVGLMRGAAYVVLLAVRSFISLHD